LRVVGEGHTPGGTFLVLTREKEKECPPLPGMSPESACTIK